MTDSTRIGYSNRLNLDRFFFTVREHVYAIVKLADFPNYYKGSDIDVFCYDKDKFIKAIQKHFGGLPTNKKSIKKILETIKPEEVIVEFTEE